jgi:hypothetical protein
MSTVHEYIIIGSGCTGAMAAQTLVEAGAKVLMLDVGIKNDENKCTPDRDFLKIRKTENNQTEFFLGKDFKHIPIDKIGTGAQLTPQRKFMIERVSELMPFVSQNFFPMESLAYGGLGNGWGLGCCVFSDAEMDAAGLDKNKMHDAYQLVADRIGISCENDDAAKYTIGALKNYSPSILPDKTGALLLRKYEKQKKKLNSNGFFLGRPALALLTTDRDDRKKYAYRDLDFYSDEEKSAYRPWITTDKLKKENGFEYKSGFLVKEFSENNGLVTVLTQNTNTNEEKIFKCKKLILASSVLSTVRIVLNSYKKYDITLPVLSNHYCYVPCIQPSLLGGVDDEMKVGFAQLSLFHDADNTNSDVAMASVYSYRSLMMMRLIQQLPLSYTDAQVFLRYMMPALTIMGIHFPEAASADKKLWLTKKNDKSELYIDYQFSELEISKNKIREKQFKSAMRKLSCYSIKTINPGAGSSIHYAGTLPFSNEKKIFSLSTDGRLNGLANIFVADGSGFRYLPAKGLTLSLMANAHLVALNALKNE